MTSFTGVWDTPPARAVERLPAAAGAENSMADIRRTVTLNGRTMTLAGHASIALVDLFADLFATDEPWRP